jgi:hypothetical protein
MTEQDRSDRIYTWTIRGLYTVAIALNVWVIWDQVKMTPEGAELEAKVERLKMLLLRPIHDRKHFRRAVAETLLDAHEIVEEAQADG